MTLTESEIREAVRRLRKTVDASVGDELGLRHVAIGLAAKLPERTPEGVRVFMLWMGDDDYPR